MTNSVYQEIRRIRKNQRESIKSFDLIDQRYMRAFFSEVASEIIKMAQDGCFPRIKYQGKWYYEKRAIRYFLSGCTQQPILFPARNLK